MELLSYYFIHQIPTEVLFFLVAEDMVLNETGVFPATRVPADEGTGTQ